MWRSRRGKRTKRNFAWYADGVSNKDHGRIPAGADEAVKRLNETVVTMPREE